MRIPRRKGIVDVVAHIDRRRRIALPQYPQQSLRMRLPIRNIIHGNDSAKVNRVRPTIKGMRKFPPRPSGEQIQLVAPRPTLDLPWSDHKFLVANIARLALRAPIELLKRG